MLSKKDTIQKFLRQDEESQQENRQARYEFIKFRKWNNKLNLKHISDNDAVHMMVDLAKFYYEKGDKTYE